MRTLAITPANATDLDNSGIVCHDVRNPTQRNEVLVRKGSHLSAVEMLALFDRGVDELHLAVPDADDVGEDDAASRLAAAVAGRGVDHGNAHLGQVSFLSAARGMLRVDRTMLDCVNGYADVLVLTAEPDRPVDSGTTLGVVKCAPLFLPERTLQAIEALPNPALEVEPFRPLRVGMVAQRDRLRGGLARAQTALSAALAWYGSSLETVIGAEASVEGLAAAYRQLLDADADLILAAGASGTDPLDMIFEGLRRAGGDVVQIGIPMEPGTACWVGRLGRAAVLGLASCELFGQPGALDLLFPALHTGESLDAPLLRRLALGGLLLGPGRIAPYHAGAG
jgi:molybdenum cofactor cytidylyltransferase